jgi:flavorubredoxin
MYHYKHITKDIYWIGGSDRRIALFENVYPVPAGVSYNSYLVKDDVNILLDTVDSSVGKVFFETLKMLLDGGRLDYAVINHMEPNHSSMLGELIRQYPNVKIVCGKQTKGMITQFFQEISEERIQVFDEGECLNTGKHEFMLIKAPMVHWPEVTFCYEKNEKILFSADAFGAFGALSGNIFADCYDVHGELLNEARRYYTNIVGKYGKQVQAVLKKASALEISHICPLHGPVWRSEIDWIVGKYLCWSSYAPEINGVLIIYGSPHGNTANAADFLAHKISDHGVNNIAVYDVSAIHPSYLVAECFKYSHLVFAAATYEAGIMANMECLLNLIKNKNLKNRTAAFIENASWAPNAAKTMSKIVGNLENMTFIESGVTIMSSVTNETLKQLDNLAKTIACSV